jgi:hypothetical protein
MTSEVIAAGRAAIVKWLEVALRPARSAPKAMEIIAALEGGLLVSRLMGDPAILRGIVSATLKRVQG